MYVHLTNLELNIDNMNIGGDDIWRPHNNFSSSIVFLWKNFYPYFNIGIHAVRWLRTKVFDMVAERVVC